MNSKEVNKGSTIYFTRKSNSAFISKLKNNKVYFISKVNKSLVESEFELSNIKNGESFYVDDINTCKDTYKTVLIHLVRKIDNTKFLVRWQDIGHFSG
jgi:hypothetical protein